MNQNIFKQKLVEEFLQRPRKQIFQQRPYDFFKDQFEIYKNKRLKEHFNNWICLDIKIRGTWYYEN